MKKIEGVRKLWDKYKYAALVALIGAGLLLWPSGGGSAEKSPLKRTEEPSSGSLQAEMADILGAMSGVGQ